MYASFNDKDIEGNFVDFLTGDTMPPALFSKNEPDGGETENCIAWSTKSEIQIKMRTNITWTEVRATYKNLKDQALLNTLPEEIREKIWIPSILYTNLNDHLFFSNIKDNLKHSSLTINKEGKGRRRLRRPYPR